MDNNYSLRNRQTCSDSSVKFAEFRFIIRKNLGSPMPALALPFDDGDESDLSPYRSRQADITELLRRAAKGDKAAESILWQEIYNQLKLLARRALSGERRASRLQATELVNMVYLRLASGGSIEWKDRQHFYLVAARVIQHIKVDLARYAKRRKRGEDCPSVEFEDWMSSVEDKAELILQIHDALAELRKEQPHGERLAEVVTLRHFAQYTEKEIGAILGVNERTVKRDWATAKAYLQAYFS